MFLKYLFKSDICAFQLLKLKMRIIQKKRNFKIFLKLFLKPFLTV